ncbi:MAG: hypothetical protein K2Y32_12350 [Candidatus Obscuribacterales bacterium]|nr:hypothetical protein [Candidatus Obscuribacterales bacterium]
MGEESVKTQASETLEQAERLPLIARDEPAKEGRSLVFFGAGRAALAVFGRLKQTDALRINKFYATTRSAERALHLQGLGIEPIICSDANELNSSTSLRVRLQAACRQSYILVSFPPDGNADKIYRDVLREVPLSGLIYISSTGVYGKQQGIIDEHTEVDKTEESARSRLDAEEIWRSLDALILRAPGLYDFEYGLHLRLLSGQYRLPGDGKNYVSRIHLKDLGKIIEAGFLRGRAGSTYVVGDLKPETHLNLVSFLCEKLGLPMPDSVPLSAVHQTLRGNRQVNGRKVLEDLKVSLDFPTYVEGYRDCLNRYTRSSN